MSGMVPEAVNLGKPRTKGVEVSQKGKEMGKIMGTDQFATAPVWPLLLGRVVKTIIIPAYSAADFAEAVRRGRFDDWGDLDDIIRQFAKQRVGLDKPTKVDLVGFDCEWWDDEARAWGKANGRPKTIDICHIMGIAIKLPREENLIVALGSRRQGDVLCLDGFSGCRRLLRLTVGSYWSRYCLVGFLSKLP